MRDGSPRRPTTTASPRQTKSPRRRNLWDPRGRDFDPGSSVNEHRDHGDVQHQLTSRVTLVAQDHRRTFPALEMLDRRSITPADRPPSSYGYTGDLARIRRSRRPQARRHGHGPQLSPRVQEAFLQRCNSVTRTIWISVKLQRLRLRGEGAPPGGGPRSPAGRSRGTYRCSARTTTIPTASTSDRYTGANVTAGGRVRDQGAFDVPLATN